MIQLSDIELLRGGKTLLKNANATLFPEHKVGLVGANGCGKSTLFALLKGELQLDSGDFQFPKDWSIASVKTRNPGIRHQCAGICAARSSRILSMPHHFAAS